MLTVHLIGSMLSDQGSHVLGRRLHHERLRLRSRVCVGQTHVTPGHAARGGQTRRQLPAAASYISQ